MIVTTPRATAPTHSESDDGHAGDTRHPSWLRQTTGLVWVLSRKNFQVRYKRAALGIVWAVVQPAFQAAFLSFVFLHVFKFGRGIPHYPVYVLSGLLPWAYFTQGVLAATSSVVDNAALVRKVAVPRLVFPLSAVGGVGLAFVASVIVLVVASLLSGTASARLLVLPLAVAAQTAVIVGAGVLMCAFHVAFRDVRYAVESLLVVGLYATPILYDAGRVPEAIRPLLAANPMSGVLSLYRYAVLGRPVESTALGITGVVVVVLATLAALAFRRRAEEFPDLV